MTKHKYRFCFVITTAILIMLSITNIYANGYNYTIDNLFIPSSNLDLDFTEDNLPITKYLSQDLSIPTTDETKNSPVILIYHAHSQEQYKNDTKNEPSKTVVDLGVLLKDHLESNYDIKVLHCKETFDLVDGKISRLDCYKRAEKTIQEILLNYPSIEVIIDLHRDAMGPGTDDTVVINNERIASLHFVNGLCEHPKMQNQYIEENLALSLQLKVQGDELYTNLIKKIYLKKYRYNLHMVPKSLLLEFGNNNNTIDEARKAIKPFSEILAKVLGLNPNIPNNE